MMEAGRDANRHRVVAACAEGNIVGYAAQSYARFHSAGRTMPTWDEHR